MINSVSLSELVTIRGGGTPDRQNPDYWNGNIPWASVKDLKDILLENTQEFITENGVNNSATNIIPTGTVVVVTRMAVGRACITKMPVAINQDLKALFCSSKLLPQYLLWFLIGASDKLEAQASGATVKGIKIDALNQLKIPLPPLEEQRRIAAILDKADAVRRKRQNAIALTEELLRSAFLEMFGDPVTNSKGWEIVELSEMLSIVSGQVDPQEAPYIDMLHIGGENIQANTGRINGVQTPREIGLQSGKYLFEPTDVLYSKIRPYLNKVVIPGFIGVCSADIYPLRVDESKLNPQYLVYLLRSKTFLEYAEKHSARTNIPKINRPALLKFTSPYPPLNLQKQFSAIYDKVHSTKNQINHAVEEGNNLFNSLLQKAFRGQL